MQSNGGAYKNILAAGIKRGLQLGQSAYLYIIAHCQVPGWRVSCRMMQNLARWIEEGGIGTDIAQSCPSARSGTMQDTRRHKTLH